MTLPALEDRKLQRALDLAEQEVGKQKRGPEALHTYRMQRPTIEVFYKTPPPPEIAPACFWSDAERAGEKGMERVDANRDDMEWVFETLTTELADLLIRKQRDYGTANIESFGEVGVLVRLHDKLARLKNLMTSGEQPKNESIDDTLYDIAGYALILLAVRRGWLYHPSKQYTIRGVS